MVEKDRGEIRVCVAMLPQLICDGIVRRRGVTVVLRREVHGFGCHRNDPSRRARDIAPLEQGDMVDVQVCGVRAELFFIGATYQWRAVLPPAVQRIRCKLSLSRTFYSSGDRIYLNKLLNCV